MLHVYYYLDRFKLQLPNCNLLIQYIVYTLNEDYMVNDYFTNKTTIALIFSQKRPSYKTDHWLLLKQKLIMRYFNAIFQYINQDDVLQLPNCGGVCVRMI